MAKTQLRKPEDRQWTALCRIYTVGQIKDCELIDALEASYLKIDSEAWERRGVKDVGQQCKGLKVTLLWDRLNIEHFLQKGKVKHDRYRREKMKQNS